MSIVIGVVVHVYAFVEAPQAPPQLAHLIQSRKKLTHVSNDHLPLKSTTIIIRARISRSIDLIFTNKTTNTMVSDVRAVTLKAITNQTTKE